MNQRSSLIVAIGDEIEALAARGVTLPLSTRLMWEPYAAEYKVEKFGVRPVIVPHTPTDTELLSALDSALDKLNA